MIYIMKFMFYAISVIAITIPVAGVITWHMDGEKVNFKDWIKTF